MQHQQNQPILTREQAEYYIRNSSDIINVKFFKKMEVLEV